MKKCFRIPLITLPLMVVLFSCANDMETIKKIIDTNIEPDLIGENVTMLYTDSARLQMKFVTPLVKQFNTAKEQRREFSEGIHVWMYEKTGELKAEITANWAKQDIETDLWEASSNVVVVNAEGQKLETEQLFWDPKKGNVYSVKYTKITSKDGTVVTGDTFTSKQDFSEWKLSRGRATIILNEENEN